MPGNPEQGAGWEVRREFVDPEKAQAAGREVLALVDGDSICEYFRESEHRPSNSKGLSIYRLAAWSPWSYPDFPHTIQNDPEALKAVENVIDIHRRTSRVVREDVHAATFNIYEPGGYTRRHRDRRAVETFALGLIGIAHARVKDPVYRTWHEFEMLPGDAMHIVNPRLQRLRPLHQFVNTGDLRRVSIIE